MIVVVLWIHAHTTGMAVSAVGININGTGQPGRRRLAAMTSGAGAGAAVATGRAALGVEVGQDVDINSAVIMYSTIMAGSTAGIHRTIPQCGVISVGSFGIRRTGATRRFSMTGVAAGVYSTRV